MIVSRNVFIRGRDDSALVGWAEHSEAQQASDISVGLRLWLRPNLQVTATSQMAFSQPLDAEALCYNPHPPRT